MDWDGSLLTHYQSKNDESYCNYLDSYGILKPMIEINQDFI